MLRLCVAFVTLWFAAAGCAQDLRAHPVHRLGTWGEMLARPLVERVEAAPPAVVEYLALERRGAARAADDPSLVADVKGAIADLPLEVNMLFVDRLAGIVLADGLGDTAVTGAVDDGHGQDVAGFVVLDAGAIAGRTANEWATARASAPFADEAPWQLEARLERGAQDTRRQAIQYALLIELGRVLAITGAVPPRWSLAASGDAIKLDEKLPASKMAVAYTQLATTGFPTLRAATRPGDDFAESFANYVHVVLMKRPWEIAIRRGGEELLHLGACWEEPRCEAKRRLLEQVVKSP